MLALYRKWKLKKRLKELRKIASYLLISNDDIMSADRKQKLRAVLDGIKTLDRKNSDAVEAFLSRNEEVVDSVHPLSGKSRSIRNFLDVLAVAFAVAFGLRALYFQPFKIPTSSMQPTLFGIHYVDKKSLNKYNSPLVKALLPPVSSRAELTVKTGGELLRTYRTYPKYLFDTESEFQIGPDKYTLPGTFLGDIAKYIDLSRDEFKPGEKLADGWLSTGDHLFVERFSLHFRSIRRGDIAVFTTEDIVSPTQPMSGFYYIKRIVGLPGDTLKIVKDVLFIKPAGAADFKPATAFSKRFEKIYSKKGGYQGHRAMGLLENENEITVPEAMFFALGDNTNNSLDGRDWGFIPRKNMIGLPLVVFWPPSRRWGLLWNDPNPAVDVPTVLPESMQIQ